MHPDRISSALRLSLDNLANEELKCSWLQLSVFPDSFDVKAAAAVLETELDETSSLLMELESYCLIEWNHETERYRLNDFLRDFARAQIGDEDREAAQRRHAWHYQRVLADADEAYLQGGQMLSAGLRLFDGERRNIQTGYTWVVNQPQPDAEARRLQIAYALQGVQVLYLRQHSVEFIRWQKNALAAAQQLADEKSQGQALGNLGLAYSDLGEVQKAIGYYEQAILISRDIGDRRGEGNHLGNLGLAYYQLGEVQKAIELMEASLKIFEEIESPSANLARQLIEGLRNK